MHVFRHVQQAMDINKGRICHENGGLAGGFKRSTTCCSCIVVQLAQPTLLGQCKSRTMDCGLDCGLKFGLHFGLLYFLEQ